MFLLKNLKVSFWENAQWIGYSEYAGSGQTVGAKYLGISEKYPLRASAFPICSNSYAPALIKVTEFAHTSVQTDYPLTLPEKSIIVGVHLLRGGATTTLAIDKYSIANGKIQIKMDLLKDDKIKIDCVIR